MGNILQVENLTKTYGSLMAVNKVSFSVQPGEIFALIGPNGAGKSTILKIIATILSPTSGKVIVDGVDIAKNPEHARSAISYLPEEAGAYKNMKGIAYLRFMASLFFTDKEKLEQAVLRAKKITGLGRRLDDKINTYSKGMTRKLLLARAVMLDPKLAILDEPTSGLDVINALAIRDTIKQMAREQGMSVLLSSHNMLEIEYLSDQVAIIDKGLIHASGTATDLKKQYSADNLEEVFIKLV